jgi:anti-sigma factor ChrR (cupin superfamily)
MKTLQDYINLAEGDYECWRTYSKFMAASRTLGPAMAKALIDAEAALRQVLADKAPSYHDCLDNGEPECAWCIASNALRQIQALNGGEDDKQR